VADSRLVIHNAEFDMRIINAELTRAGRTIISMDRVLDTLVLARRKHPGVPNSLDALCARYHIDNSRRVKHGALLDSEILAEIYIELTGGHQKALAFADPVAQSARFSKAPAQTRHAPLRGALTGDEAQMHTQFIAELGSSAIWTEYSS
ncbi:MAG: exonuclease domain-containing protein, partial [Beijerinckiaceae bacterium]